jgi:hypothetical protein
MSGIASKIEISTNGSTWVDISGATNMVDVPEQSRMSGAAYTFDGDGAVLARGKREPIDLTVTIIYTEVDSTEPFEVVRGLHETDDGADIYLRWSPDGGGTGDNQYSTGASNLSGFQYPPVNSASGDPIVTTFTVTAALITTAAVSS